MKVTSVEMQYLLAESTKRGMEVAEVQLDKLRANIRNNPGGALIAALGIGLVLGLIVRRVY